MVRILLTWTLGAVIVLLLGCQRADNQSQRTEPELNQQVGRVEMEKVILQFRQAGDEPTLAEVAARFGLTMQEVDQQYGVIATDPDAGLYTVLIDSKAGGKAQSKLDARGAAPDEGVFSNPRIESMERSQ
jgi:hypothetical protein